MSEISAPIWRKSARSNGAGHCVEVATNLVASTGAVLVRDSKDPRGPVLAVTRAGWAAFTGGIHDGTFGR